jgi:hypothetical protein
MKNLEGWTRGQCGGADSRNTELSANLIPPEFRELPRFHQIPAGISGGQ